MGAVKNLVIGAKEKDEKKERMVQFNHVCTYPRKISAMHKSEGESESRGDGRKTKKWTVADIAREADRHNQHIRHVMNPIPPILLKGVKLNELEDICELMLEGCRTKEGKRVRKDTHVLLSAVYSLPISPDNYLLNRDYCHDFFTDAMGWHESEYGPVASAVMHLDESMIHIHVMTLDKDARSLVAGWRAKREAIEEAAAKGVAKASAARIGNVAFKKEMQALQDRFYEQVGKKHGLNRYGDRRMRYTPEEGRAQRLAREANMLKERELRAREEQDRIVLREKLQQQEDDALKLEIEKIQITQKALELKQVGVDLLTERHSLDEENDRLEQSKNAFKAVLQKKAEFIEKVASQPGWQIQRELEATAKRLQAAKVEIVQLKEEAEERESFVQMLRERLDRAGQLLRKFAPSDILRSIWGTTPTPGKPSN